MPRSKAPTSGSPPSTPPSRPSKPATSKPRPSTGELLNQRAEVARQAAAEDAKLQAEMGREAAANTQAMGQLALAADQEAQALRDSAHRETIQRRMAEEAAAENAEYELKKQALDAETSALDRGAKDYEVKLQALYNKREQLTREHENRLTQIQDQAEKECNARILSAEGQFEDMIAGGLTRVLMAHQSFAAMMNSIGDQVAWGMIQNALKDVMAKIKDLCHLGGIPCSTCNRNGSPPKRQRCT